MMRGFQTILQSSLGKPWISGKPWHIQRRDGLGFGWDGLNLPSLKIHSQCYKFHASTMFNWFIQIPGDFFRSYGRKITIFDVLKNHHVYIYMFIIYFYGRFSMFLCSITIGYPLWFTIQKVPAEHPQGQRWCCHADPLPAGPGTHWRFEELISV